MQYHFGGKHVNSGREYPTRALEPGTRSEVIIRVVQVQNFRDRVVVLIKSFQKRVWQSRISCSPISQSSPAPQSGYLT